MLKRLRRHKRFDVLCEYLEFDDLFWATHLAVFSDLPSQKCFFINVRGDIKRAIRKRSPLVAS